MSRSGDRDDSTNYRILLIRCQEQKQTSREGGFFQLMAGQTAGASGRRSLLLRLFYLSLYLQRVGR